MCSVFDGWFTACKELWTNYPHTWNMEACSCSVIMGDLICHSSDLRRVSVLHKLQHTLIPLTMHHLLDIKQTVCVGSVSLTVSFTKSLNPSQPGQCLSDHFYTRGDGTCVYFFSRGNFEILFFVGFFFAIGTHRETEVLFECVKAAGRV